MKEVHRKKLLNILLLILNDFRSGVDYIKLYKILYFAHRKHLAETGLPLVNDTFKAWRYGPVPSFAGSLVKRLEKKEVLPPDMLIFKGKMRVNPRKKVFGKCQPDLEYLTPTEIRIIRDTVLESKYVKSRKLSDISHMDIAWQEAYKRHRELESSPVMKQSRIAEDGNASAHIVELVREYYSVNKDVYNHKTRPELTEKLNEIVSMLTESLRMSAGWDGEDAEAINPLSVWNCRSFVAMRSAHIELVKYVYPTPSGNICVDWIECGNKVSCEFGPHKMAFYYQSADRREVYESPTMDVNQDSFTQLAKCLERI